MQSMRGSAAAGFLAVLTALGPSSAAQQRLNLPPPDSSRPPVLTRLPADSIRVQVRQLRLWELLGSLQRADTAALRVALAGVKWGATGEESHSVPECPTITSVVTTLAAGFGVSVSRRAVLPIFFYHVAVADSGGVGIAKGRVRVISLTSGPTTAPVSFTYDSTDARFVTIVGLLDALCRAATAVHR